MLHTRILCYLGVIFSVYQFDKIRDANSDSIIHRNMAEGLLWLILFIIVGYSSKAAMEALLNIISARFGVKLPAGSTVERTETKKETVTVAKK